MTTHKLMIDAIAATIAAGLIPSLDLVPTRTLLALDDAAVDQAGELLKRCAVERAAPYVHLSELIQVELARRGEQLGEELGALEDAK